jgi:hypothetical protein
MRESSKHRRKEKEMSKIHRTYNTYNKYITNPESLKETSSIGNIIIHD